jgi:hypothetical protein
MCHLMSVMDSLGSDTPIVERRTNGTVLVSLTGLPVIDCLCLRATCLGLFSGEGGHGMGGR